MESERKEKAIQQAQASLKIDGIILRQEFIASFREKKGLPQKRNQSLVLKRSSANGKRNY